MTIFSLRLIAMVSMLIDHIAAVFLVDSPYYIFCRMIGRLAFPIFVFLLLEGYRNSSNIPRYCRRLYVVAVFSQIPFMVLWPEPFHLNVCFSLLAGLLCFYFFYSSYTKDLTWKWFLIFLGVMVCFAGAEYGCDGLFLLMAFYIWRYGSGRFRVLLPVFCCIVCSINYLGAGVLALPLIALYHGEQGRRLPRWLVYGFYPVHLCILALLYV